MTTNTNLDIGITILTNEDSGKTIVKQHTFSNGAYKQISAPTAGHLSAISGWTDSLSTFRDILEELGNDQCIMPSILKPHLLHELGDPIEYHIAPKETIKSYLGYQRSDNVDVSGLYDIDGKPTMGRLKNNFDCSNLVLLDYDVDEHTPSELIFSTHDEYIQALSIVFPELKHAGWVFKHSSSANLYLPDGTPHNGGSPKRHAYFVCKDPVDLGRFNDVLFKRLWLAGMGYFQPSKSGAGLKRTIYDKVVVNSSERIVFEGAPLLHNGVTQNNPPPEYRPGIVIDTKRLPDLSNEEELEYAKLTGGKVRTKTFVDNGRFVKKTYAVSNSTRKFDLTPDTQVVRGDDPTTVRTVKEFLDSGDSEWHVYAAPRWGDMNEFVKNPYNHDPSAWLTRLDNGQALLYEHATQTTHRMIKNLPSTTSRFSKRKHGQTNNEKIKESSEPSFVEKWFFDTDPVTQMKMDIRMQVEEKLDRLLHDVHRRQVIILYGPEGVGKSRFADKCAEKGWNVVFACQSNEQAVAQSNGNPYSENRLVVSRGYKLFQDYGIEPVFQPSDVPWGTGEYDDILTVQSMVQSGQFRNEEHAQHVWDEIKGDEPSFGKGVKTYCTQAMSKVWGCAHKTERREFQTVLYYDDPPLGDFVDLFRVTTENQYLGQKIDDDGESLIGHRRVNGLNYWVRPTEYRLGVGYKQSALVITTSEQMVVQLAKQYFPKNRLKVVDLTPNSDDWKHPVADVVMIGTDLVRKRYHGLFHPVSETLKHQGHDFHLIGDGNGSEENTATVKGRNDMMSKHTLIKISQPNQYQLEDMASVLGLDILDKETKSQTFKVLKEFLMIDQLNQCLGRNQGARYTDKQAIVLADSSFLRVLESQCRYEMRIADQLKDINTRDLNGLAKTIVELLQNLDGYTGTKDFLEYQSNDHRKQSSYQMARGELIKKQDKEMDRFEERLTKATKMALSGRNWRDIVRTLHLDRYTHLRTTMDMKAVVEEVVASIDAEV